MNRIVPFLCLAVLFAGGCATLSTGNDTAVIRAKDNVAPALVHIRPVKEVFRRGQREEQLVVGSGFIISPDGYVVTNEHVAGKSRSVRCVLSNQDEVDAEIIGADPYTDIAVLKLKTDRRDLPYVRLGDSSKLEAGETVLALGSPHGLARSVSAGIVSVTDRYLESGGETISLYNNWIQTDAAINPGNSGGPLVNLKGEVIGINTRRLSFADNVGFAIPIDIAKEVIDELIANGRVQRSTIGAEFQALTSTTDDPAARGVVISDVDPLSPASRALLRPGDVLLAVNGVEVDARYEEDLSAIRKRIADLPIGAEVSLTIKRGPQQADVVLATEENRRVAQEEIEFADWGFSLSELTPDVIRQAQLTSLNGVVVTGTQVGGRAATANLQRGEIILRVDDDEVENLTNFQEIYDERLDSEREMVLLTVKRGALTRYVLIKQGPRPVPLGGMPSGG